MKVTVHVAKTTLSRLIERAHAGEEIVIARGDVPVARLVPIEAARPPRRQPGTLRRLVKIDEAFFEPLPEAELEAWGPRILSVASTRTRGCGGRR
ncbi:MAG TPA: type II toxin-antitoxin system Phd/YefM family antitoxin [Kofleriaceae bacterium]|nr:type II toxin-antitoxin system Phd/YefM family antitoxin [Kofleriaceae bacterium]